MEDEFYRRVNAVSDLAMEARKTKKQNKHRKTQISLDECKEYLLDECKESTYCH